VAKTKSRARRLRAAEAKRKLWHHAHQHSNETVEHPRAMATETKNISPPIHLETLLELPTPVRTTDNSNMRSGHDDACKLIRQEAKTEMTASASHVNPCDRKGNCNCEPASRDDSNCLCRMLSASLLLSTAMAHQQSSCPKSV